MTEEMKQQQIAQIIMRPGNDGNGAIISFSILGTYETAIVVPEQVVQAFLKERLKFKQEQAHMLELMSRKGVRNVG